MNSTKSYMINRALKSLADEINKVSENLNTWAVMLKQLIKLRRKLLRTPSADRDLYTVADAFSKLFYKNGAKVDEYHLDSDLDSDVDSDVDEDSDGSDLPEDDLDIQDDSDVDLSSKVGSYGSSRQSHVSSKVGNYGSSRQSHVSSKAGSYGSSRQSHVSSKAGSYVSGQADHRPKRKNKSKQNQKTKARDSTDMFLTDNATKISDMQKAALSVLSEEEQAAAELAEHMEQKRKEYAASAAKGPPPSAPIRFTLDIDKTLDPVTGLPIDCSVVRSDDEYTVFEENVHPLIAMQKKEPLIGQVNGENTFSRQDNLDNSTSPTTLPAVELRDQTQKDNPAKNDVSGGVDISQNAPQSDSRPTNTAHVTEVDHNPKYGPLFRLSANKRRELQYSWFQQAISTIDAQIKNNELGPITPRTRDKLIRDETTKLQDLYCEANMY